MRKKMNQWICGSLMAGTAVLAGSQANAALIIDVRTSTGGKTASVSAVNDVVTMNIYAVVTGADANSNEGATIAQGSLLSGTGGLLGNISAVSVSANFQGLGFTTGAAFDNDSDSDTDRGAVNGGTATNYIAFRGTTAPVTGGTPVTWGGTAGNEYLLGTATFTVAALNAAGTTLNWLPRLGATGASVTSSASWQEDGAGTKNAGNLAYNSSTSPYRSGAPIVVSVPEPTGMGVMALAGGLLSLRRRNRTA